MAARAGGCEGPLLYFRAVPMQALCQLNAGTQQMLLGTGVSVWRSGQRGLLAVCFDQALHELVDVARLGQLALVQQVAQLGLGQALVALAGLVMGVPGLLALGLASLAGQLLLGLLGQFGLLAGGLLGLAGLLVHEVAGRPGLLTDETGN